MAISLFGDVFGYANKLLGYLLHELDEMIDFATKCKKTI